MSTLKAVDSAFRIYGDNILECENFIDWLRDEKLSNFTFISTEGSIDRPIYICRDKKSDKTIAVQLCPYYGGTGPSILWSNNPIGDIFDEKTDVIITKVFSDGTESRPLLAIEFVDALMAGNQGWQRFRRAINAAEAGIPYLYVLPILGWERDSEGIVLKNPRFLPATVCLAQLSLCCEYGVPSFQIYTVSDWSDYAFEKQYSLPDNFKDFKGIENATILSSILIRYYIEEKIYPKNQLRDVYEEIIEEMISVGYTYSKFGNTVLPIHINHPSLNPTKREEVASLYADYLSRNEPIKGKYALSDISEEDFFKYGSPFYKDAQDKTCSVSFKNNILSVLNWKDNEEQSKKIKYLRSWGIEVDSRVTPDQLTSIFNKNKRLLPITYKQGKSEAALLKNRKSFRALIERTYPNVDSKILDWIYDKKQDDSALFVIPLYAYKPSGDSRPDRGLIPLLKALFPSLVLKDRTIVLIYSKYTPTNWKKLLSDGNNELWNSIKVTSGVIIVDKTGDGVLLNEK
jgi:hypothetical protein